MQALEDEDALQSWKVAHLGRSSPLMGTFDQLRDVPKEQRPAIGRRANEVKQALESLLNQSVYRQNAISMQSAIQDSGGPAEAAAIIEQVFATGRAVPPNASV